MTSPSPNGRLTRSAGRLTAEGRTDGLLLLAAMVLLMWTTEGVDQILGGGDLDKYGITPRNADGLEGIPAAPFLHVGFDHLISNTVPFVLMGGAIALGGLKRIALVTLIVAGISGIGTWLLAGSGTVHLGASGVVFGYASYLVFRGVFTRNLVWLALGVAVALVWGSALLGGLLPEDGISWQAHLFGAIGGVVAAKVLAPEGRKTEGA